MSWRDAPLVESQSWRTAPLVEESAPEPQKRSALDEAKRQALLLGRSALNTAAALPLAALEGGAGIANIATGGNVSFRRQWDEGLDAAGLPRPESGIEKVTDVAAQVLLGSKIPAPGVRQSAPQGFRTAAEAKTLARADQVRKAQEAGYVIPPATGNPQSTQARVMEGIAGKLATGQRASAKNMAVTDKLAARALGLSDDAPVTLQSVRAVRQEAGRAYENVRDIGIISLGKPWHAVLNKAEMSMRGANRSFPGLGKSDASTKIAALRQNFMDSSDAVDAIRVLRDYADDAGAARNKKLARTFRSLATELENRIERHLVANGQTGLVDAFRKSRQLIAKTYDVENAMNKATGSVSATKIARRLDRGAPLTDELRAIGEFGAAFPKAAREFNESLPAFSPLDIYAGGGGALLGSMATGGAPASVLPLAYPFMRLGLQNGLLTPFGQRLARPAIQQGLSGQTVMGATHGLLAPLGQ